MMANQKNLRRTSSEWGITFRVGQITNVVNPSPLTNAMKAKGDPATWVSLCLVEQVGTKIWNPPRLDLLGPLIEATLVHFPKTPA